MLFHCWIARRCCWFGSDLCVEGRTLSFGGRSTSALINPTAARLTRSTECCFLKVSKSSGSERNKIAIAVNAYGTRIAKILPGCLTLVLFSQPAAPQANNKSAQDGSVKIEVNVNDVLVPVVVRKAQGRGVGDLKKEDFRVFDQGQLKVISGFKVQTRSAAWDGRQDAESTSSDAHLVVPGVLPPAAAQTQTHQAMSVPLQVAEISQATSPPVNETPPSSASPPTSLDSRSPKNKAAEIPQATSGQSAAPAPNRPVRLFPDRPKIDNAQLKLGTTSS